VVVVAFLALVAVLLFFAVIAVAVTSAGGLN
jgi:hypothetical protein